MRFAVRWMHMRRPFYEFFAATQPPLAAEVRHYRNQPIVDVLHAGLQDRAGRVSAVSDLAKAIRYAIRHWDGLRVFLDDGRVEMDTDVVERGIPPKRVAFAAGPDAF